MPRTTYALLVGINAYAPEVGRLSGCLNDVDHFENWLRANTENPAIEMLKDGDATRANVIRLFRTHLAQARKDDTVVFHYCGHGARWASAPDFRTYFPDGRDEGLVLFDSRTDGGYDLADKELAVLISELAEHEAHIAVLLDCCHSGSGTRGADAFRGLVARQTHEVAVPRPLETYLDGYYTRTKLTIPTPRHILLAACERGQTAKESPDHAGVFTSTLIEALGKGADISYIDLFQRCRATVRTRAEDQTPQFEPAGGFDPTQGFLGRPATATRRFYPLVFADTGHWNAACGAIHGLPTDPFGLAIYADDDATLTTRLGTAITKRVGAQTSDVDLDFASDIGQRYRAVPLVMPGPPMLLAFDGPADAANTIEATLRDAGLAIALVPPGQAQYGIALTTDRLTLHGANAEKIIGFTSRGGKTLSQTLAILAPTLRAIAQWEQSLRLRNPKSRLDADAVTLRYIETPDDATEHIHTGEDVTLEYIFADGDWQNINGRFEVSNTTGQTLHMMLVHFTEAFGIYIRRQDEVPPGTTAQNFYGDDDYFWLEDGTDQAVETYKLFITTERADGFLIEQEDLPIGGELGTLRATGARKPRETTILRDEWRTLDCRIRIVRRLDRVSPRDSRLAGGRIVVRAHPTLTASLSLAAAIAPSRTPGFDRAFTAQGLDLMNFAATRGDNLSVLELSGIQNAAALAETPLTIDIAVPLAPGEILLPVAFDGTHAHLAGDTSPQPDGTTRLTITTIPETQDTRRSIGSALKLYFFKTYLKSENPNTLAWVEFPESGSPILHKSGVGEKVAAATRVLLLIHGIIGDAAAIAAGIAATDLPTHFDLVLAYDYENLATPIADTATKLQSQLAAAGLAANDGKHLTILAHSMGGLVSRWLIERESGNRTVDHLVLCGTPNHGSPFGQIDGARKILAGLTTLAMNYLPPLIPFGSGLLYLLNRSKKLSPTLEQMNPASDFIRTLNASPDPAIPYTILAGDVSTYNEASDPLFPRLLAHLAQTTAFGLLFAEKPNDIAVSLDSIRTVAAATTTRTDIACHHLNYFTSPTGRDALRAVKW
jgi:pimeloyl-ACP methyl ester carboxylesterase